MPDVIIDANPPRDGGSPGSDTSAPPDAPRDQATPDGGPKVDASKDNASDVSPPQPDVTDAGGADANDGCIGNACGGCGVLAGAPGSKCGSCGTYECSADKSSVNCDNDPGLNACGGCGVLAGAPGSKCGTCGTYVCSADKSSVDCDHPDPLTVTQISAGGEHTCVVLSTGGIRCWGRNDGGALGDGTVVNRLQPPDKDVVTNVTDFVAVSAGNNHTCALRGSGGVRCWGNNDFGQLGTGTYASTSTAMGADILAAATSISAGSDFSCALRSGGTERCWGSNGGGALGDGSMSDNRPTPGVDVSNLGGIGAISGSCALAAGDVHCWGPGTSGRIGDGSGTDFYTPSATVLTGASAITAGASHTCAIVSEGVRCWGLNVSGQLGDGRQARNVYTPPTTDVISGAIVVAAGDLSTCALLNSGAVRCWGNNDKGQVGDGTNFERLTPVAVAGLEGGVTAIAVGGMHACALLNTGEIRCWGRNDSGQVGDGTLVDRASPVNVAPMCP